MFYLFFVWKYSVLCADLVVCHRPIFETKVKLPSEIKPPFKANSERPLPEAPLGGLRWIYLNFNFGIQKREQRDK